MSADDLTARTEPAVGPGRTHVGHLDRPGRLDRFERVPWVAVAVFVAVSFGLAWLIALPLWLGAAGDGAMAGVIASVISVCMMFTPAVATLVVLFVMRAPRSDRMRLLGMWPLRPAKRVVWFAVGGLVVPIIVCVLSLGVAALCGWITLDLVNFSGFQAVLDAQTGPGVIDAQVIVWVQLAMIPFGAIINMIPAFGEEIGWRGWLVPALRPLGLWPALLVSGAIWGLWHSPLILLGHNFGLTDWRGVALMTVGCVVWGSLLGWARLRSGSVWPAVVGHGSLNAAAGLFALAAVQGDALQLPLVNPLGVSGWIVVAAGIVTIVCLGQFAKEPELAAPKTR